MRTQKEICSVLYSEHRKSTSTKSNMLR